MHNDLRNTEYSHPVYYIEDTCLLHDLLSKACSFVSSVFILVDENTRELCLPVFLKKLPEDVNYHIIEIGAGEENKTIESCQTVWDELTNRKADRKSLLINLGGGVITDLGGFAASVFKRGIGFIHVPTTLMGQVDASIGGKTAINLENIKNQVGLFTMPEMVVIDPAFLQTLPGKEILSGFAEVLKHGLIKDKSYWETVRNIDPGTAVNWNDIIPVSIDIKSEIAFSDFHEKGQRKLLNFGHSVGHALETFFNKKTAGAVSHGEAVAAGMLCEAYISSKLTGLPEKELKEITSTIQRNYQKLEFTSKEVDEIATLVYHDKKNVRDQLNFTLLSGIGQAIVDQSVKLEQLKECLNYYREMF